MIAVYLIITGVQVFKVVLIICRHPVYELAQRLQEIRSTQLVGWVPSDIYLIN